MDNSSVSFNQRNFGTRLKFTFEPRQLIYSRRDRSGAVQFATPYENIEATRTSAMTVSALRHGPQKAVAYLLMIISVFAFANLVHESWLPARILSAIFLALCVLGIWWMSRQSVTYTLLLVAGGTPVLGNQQIKIIHDRNHDAILGEIKSRWRERVRQLHATVNFANDLAKELARFSWLKDHEVISEKEYQTAADQIQAYQQSQSMTANRTVN